MTVNVPILKTSGDVAERSVDPEVFRRRGSKVLLKEAVIMAEARMRVGTHAAKTRGEINGTSAKMYRQKGTGNARHGNRKAGQLRGGGMIHAKKPRDYGWAMPKKARRAALAGALRAKLDDGEIKVIENFGIEQPRTKDFIALMDRLELGGSSFLVVPAEHNDAVWRSSRNVKGAHYRVMSDLNAYEILKARYLVIEDAALKALEERFGNA
jgi:large subunit ribosomal protein L4